MQVRNLVTALALSLAFAGAAMAQGVSQASADKYNAGQDLFEKRRYNEALKSFEEAVNLDGKNAQAYRAMGRTYQKLRNVAKAVEAYQMATTVKPDYAAAYFELGELQAATRKYVDAQASFKKVIEIDPGFEGGKARANLQKVYLAQGNEYFKRKNFKSAAEQYENAGQLDPTDATAFYYLGLAQKYGRNYNSAEQAFSTAIDLDEGHAKAHRALGDLYRETGKNSQAESAYLKAIQADNSDTRSRLSLAVVYQEMNQNDKAIATLRKAIEVNPKEDDLHNALGKAYADAKQYKSALDAYTSALAIKNDPEYHYRSAVAHFELKQFQSAISSANKAVGASKWKVPANVILGDSYRELGQKDKAVEHYKQGLGDRIYKKYCEDQIDRIKNPMGGGETPATGDQ